VEPPRLSETRGKSVVIDATKRDMELRRLRGRMADKYLILIGSGGALPPIPPTESIGLFDRDGLFD
jgi:hypothetical protein